MPAKLLRSRSMLPREDVGRLSWKKLQHALGCLQRSTDLMLFAKFLKSINVDGLHVFYWVQRPQLRIEGVPKRPGSKWGIRE